MKNMENKIKIINEQINKINELDKKIQNELSIKIPKYILDEIIVGGTKENIIALTKLAKLNNRITEQDANIFIKNLDKYLWYVLKTTFVEKRVSKNTVLW